MNANALRLSLLAACILVVSLRPARSAERQLPSLPAPGEKIRVIIDSDAACEIDDLYAISLAVLSQDRFDIEGFVGAHFGDSGGPDGVRKSVEAIRTVLDQAGMAGRFPVKHGSDPFQYSARPMESEGVDFIIERAMAAGEERPLWVVSLGACTDIASAYLKRPEIARRIVAFYHGRTRWPDKAWNFNVYNDLKAARILLKSDLPLVLFDTGTHLVCPMEQSEKELAPLGALGRFLHEFRYRRKSFQSPTKGFFDLGDVAALVDPSLVQCVVEDAPEIRWDMTYDHGKTHGKMLRIYSIQRDATFALLHRRLAAAQRAK